MSKYSSKGKEWDKKRQQVLKNYDYCCVSCGYDGRANPSDMHVDHVIAKANGGTDDIENLVLLCGTGGNKCNLKKGARMQKDSPTWFDSMIFPNGFKMPGGM
jgi:5-methylcytosine-specific restriction endonuclease McrA